jgi:hypothetical protein
MINWEMAGRQTACSMRLYLNLPDFKNPFNLHSQISSTSGNRTFGSFVHDAPISKPTATIGLTFKCIEQHG